MEISQVFCKKGNGHLSMIFLEIQYLVDILVFSLDIVSSAKKWECRVRSEVKWFLLLLAFFFPLFLVLFLMFLN